ncbi:MAG: hypothetical protein V7711_05470 [Pseudomonadales bacterium]
MRLLTILTVLFLSACSTTNTPNATVFPYQLGDEPDKLKEIKNVIIGSHNYGKPSRSYLDDHEAKVDRHIVKYLEANGFTVLDSAIYKESYAEAIREHGNPYDETTGRIDSNTRQRVLVDMRQKMEDHGGIDAIIFTDLLERQVMFTSGQKRVARWDGVSRPPRTQGPGSGVTADFNWAKFVDAVSIAIYVFSIEGKPVFYSVGGMSLTESVDTKGTAKFARSKSVLSSDSQIEEGIKLAFHPFIPLENYPEKP